MLGTFAVRAGELLAAVLAAGIAALAAVAGGVWWLKRRVRRLGRLGRAAAGRAGLVAAGAAGAGRRWLWSRPVPDRRWLAAVRERRRLWRAVGAAEHAVAAARLAGAPTGDLEGLCRRLRQSAGNADRVLAVQGSAAAGGGLGPASAQARDLQVTAGLIRDAAVSVAAAMAQPAAGSLAEDVRREVTALSAGIASAAGAAGEPG
jgi:hypothetical protein